MYRQKEVEEYGPVVAQFEMVRWPKNIRELEAKKEKGKFYRLYRDRYKCGLHRLFR